MRLGRCTVQQVAGRAWIVLTVCSVLLVLVCDRLQRTLPTPLRLLLCQFLSATGQRAGSTSCRPLPQHAAPAPKLTPTFPVSLPYVTGQETTRN
jgi:hypothetical protein